MAAATSGCWAKVEAWRLQPGNGAGMSREEELWKEEAAMVEVVEEMEEEEKE